MGRPVKPCILLLASAVACAHTADPRPPFGVVEATIPQMRVAMEQRRVTSRQLVLSSLARIATYEDRLNAVITVSREALAEADARDRERAQGKIRGPLHGIPIALKDNIHTRDMPTTGGALAFEGLVPPYEATLTGHLRRAGAVIIAKTGMTELANWVGAGMPGCYNALAGHGMNPYDPRRDPRDATSDGRPALAASGSTSGIGTAASFWAANVGTETAGSLLSPASQTMLVAIKPTVGRVSRYGVIPLTADQDTPGPMARTVTDAAIVLGVLEGEGPDPGDPATTRCPTGGDYGRFLDAGALRGARIGIPRAFFYDRVAGADQPRGGLDGAEARLMAEVIDVLRKQGASLVDPADIPSIVTQDPEDSFLRWPICGGSRRTDCSVAFTYGMKRDFNAWLRSLGGVAPVKTLAELRAWNLAHAKGGAIRYGQAQLDASDEIDIETDRVRYRHDRAKDLRLAATTGIDAAMSEHRLDALLFPGASGAAIAARVGYPSVIVPAGFVPNAPTPPFPAGFAARPSPYGVTFTGRACSEPRLIALAFAFEQATHRRVPPPSMP